MRTVSLWQILEVDSILKAPVNNNVRVGVIILKSNFLNKGDKGIINLESSVPINIGDVLKLTCFTSEEDKETLIKGNDEEIYTFEYRGSRCERWNKDLESWDKIAEISTKKG